MRIAITGAASGIGAATVARLKGDGHNVTAFDIAEPAGVDKWIPVDMSDIEAIRAAVAQVEGPFDALINNAGLPPRKGLEAKILAVNALGLVALVEALLPILAPGAAIVTTASRAGARWAENAAQAKALLSLEDPLALPAFIADHSIDPIRAYDLSKEAVIVWTKANTERLFALGLRANTVSPAAVDTGILADFVTAFGDRATRAMARTGGAGKPEDIAEVIAFLASPASAWVRGANIEVDGGVSANASADQMGLR